MSRSLKQPNQHFKKAAKHLPLGVSSNFRYWGENKTIYIDHSFTGQPSMAGLFSKQAAPGNYREWLNSDSTFYDTMAVELHEPGILCEPDSREPRFKCEAHASDNCLAQTLLGFGKAVDITQRKLG